jgi:hypothetical protein
VFLVGDAFDQWCDGYDRGSIGHCFVFVVEKNRDRCSSNESHSPRQRSVKCVAIHNEHFSACSWCQCVYGSACASSPVLFSG